MIDEKKLIEEIDNNVVGLTNIQIMQIADIIEEQPKIATDTNVGCKWIPCSERLPEDGREVFITLFGELREIGWYDWNDKTWYTEEFDCDEGTVLAWMPLPEPYKGGRIKLIEFVALGGIILLFAFCILCLFALIPPVITMWFDFIETLRNIFGR